MRTPKAGDKIRWGGFEYMVVSTNPRIVKSLSAPFYEYNMEKMQYAPYTWDELISGGADIEFLEDPFVLFVRDVLDTERG